MEEEEEEEDKKTKRRALGGFCWRLTTEELRG